MSFQTKAITPINPSTSWAGCQTCNGCYANCGGRPWWSGRHSCRDDGDDILCLNWPDGGKGYCPTYGPVLSAESQGDNSQKIKCTYSSIDPLKVFDDQVARNFETDTVTGPNGYRKQYCMSLTNPNDLIAKRDDCLQYFGGGGGEGGGLVFDSRVISLCKAIPNNGWASIDACVEAARRSVQNNDSNAGAAGNMLNIFCRGGNGTDRTATGAGNHRSDPRCGCINAHDLGFKGAGNCLETANQSLPGCDKMYAKMKPLVESGGPGLQAIQAFTTDPGCISEECNLAKMPLDVAGASVSYNMFPYYGAAADCTDVQFNICDIQINQRVAMNSAVQAQCNFPAPDAGSSGGSGGAASGAPGPSGAPGSSPFDEDSKKLPVTWGPFAKIFDTETKQYAFMSSCCVTCLLLIVLLIFMMKGPGGPSSRNLLAAKLASI